MAVLLVIVTFGLFWPATHYDFINFDDPEYVSSNVHVQKGLTVESIKWALFHVVSANWHPLTMLSHMLDCQLFGLNPWGHHLTSVLLHAINTILVFALLRQASGAIWRSFFVAAFFGLHPLRIESVVWVAERKDVLCGCLGLLSLVFYVRYAQRVTPAKEPQSHARPVPALKSHPATLDYSLALFFLGLGLMSKPMLVTWPFVMLLLDYWPLERFKHRNGWRLLAEKTPFFAIATMASVLTFVVQKQEGAIVASENLKLGARGGNALVSYSKYLGKTFWPMDLAVLYPHPGYWPLARVLLAGGLMAGVSMLFWLKRRRYPFLLMGWLWYCGTLVPGSVSCRQVHTRWPIGILTCHPLECSFSRSGVRMNWHRIAVTSRFRC